MMTGALETTSEFVLMLLSLGTIAAMLVYLRKLRAQKRPTDYVVVFWTIPQAILALYYFLVWRDVQPFYSSIPYREALIRPGLTFGMIFLIVFLSNGTINRAINKMLHPRKK